MPRPKRKFVVGTTRLVVSRYTNELGESQDLTAHFGELYPGRCDGDCEYVVFRMHDPSDGEDYNEEFIVEVEQLKALIVMAQAWNRMITVNEQAEIVDAE